MGERGKVVWHSCTADLEKNNYDEIFQFKTIAICGYLVHFGYYRECSYDLTEFRVITEELDIWDSP